MTAKKKPRNRAAQETTLINLRALKKQIAALTKRVKALEDSGCYGPVTGPVLD